LKKENDLNKKNKKKQGIKV